MQLGKQVEVHSRSFRKIPFNAETYAKQRFLLTVSFRAVLLIFCTVPTRCRHGADTRDPRGVQNAHCPADKTDC